jgi:hypothetical protein
MSATVGIKGFSLNIGKNGTYLNTGIPGTGIYDRIKIGDNKDIPPSGPDSFPKNSNDMFSFHEIKSFQPELLTSDGLFGLKESIIKSQEEKLNLKNELMRAKSKYTGSTVLLIFSYLLILGIFIKWFKKNRAERKTDYLEVKLIYDNYKLEIDFNLDDETLNDYIILENTFDKISKSIKIWDITTFQHNDRVRTRSAASKIITREIVQLSKGTLDYIQTKYTPLIFHNANGGDLFIYPGFIIMPSKMNQSFAIIDYRDIVFEHHPQPFIETDSVPSDSAVIDYTWRYVNKNGSPDKRFNNNYKIPIVKYYDLNLTSGKGLCESYQFSNAISAEAFSKAFENYCTSIKKMNWKSELL